MTNIKDRNIRYFLFWFLDLDASFRIERSTEKHDIRWIADAILWDKKIVSYLMQKLPIDNPVFEEFRMRYDD